MAKVKISDIDAICTKHGFVKGRRKYYDAPPQTVWRLVDSVGAILFEIGYETYDGPVVSFGRSDIDLTSNNALQMVESRVAALAEKLKDRLIATVPSDQKIWKWLNANMVISKSDLRYGSTTYTNRGGILLLYNTESRLAWTPMINGSDNEEIGGSSAAALGQIGMNVDSMIVWLEKHGIKKKTGRR